MRSGNVYTHLFRGRKHVKKHRFIGALFFTFVFLFGFSDSAMANPTFATPGPENIVVCGTGTISLDAYLRVLDDTLNQPETYSVNTFGSGTVGGLGTFLISPTFDVTPSGITYTSSQTFGNDYFVIQVSDDNGNIATKAFNVTIEGVPAISLTDPNPEVCIGATTATIAFGGLIHAGPATDTFSFSGGVQNWKVPAGLTTVSFDMLGAAGGRDNFSGAPNPGKGGRIQGNLTVTPGDMLHLFVGGVGGDGTALGATGGYNGGASATAYSFGCGGAGGGATDIRVGGTALTDRVVVAGGGGGNGWDSPDPVAGGDGGNTIGGNSGANSAGDYASGGTQIAGGSAAATTGFVPASDGMFGVGGQNSIQGISGAGGGGYYGGGGGLNCGGAGGSSYADAGLASAVTHTRGVRDGNGRIVFNYVIPTTYTITWDAASLSAGFTNITAALPSSSPLSITVPATATAGPTGTTYNGILTISNPTCTSVTYPISVKVKPVPDVFPTPDQILCNGDTTVDINFSGTITANFNWTNDNTSIGSVLAASSGHIAAFEVVSGTSAPRVANFVVTPSINGCTGTPDTFKIVANPVPHLSSTLTPPAICDSTLFSYLPTSPVVDSTVFTWSRAAVTGIANASASGSNNPNEYLDNTGTTVVPVVYVDTLKAYGCMSITQVTVNVNPSTALTTTLTPDSICDGTVFDYAPAATAPGTLFTWSRPAVAGISNSAATGSGNPMEALDNTVATQVLVTYNYTLNINGCTYNQDVKVKVNPTAVLTTPTSYPPVCDSLLFSHPPASNVSSAVITWSRPAITGLANPAASGAGDPNEVLVNTLPTPITVYYIDTLKAFGCQNIQTVSIVVKPRPRLSSPLVPPAVCDSTLFAYTATSLTGGTTFNWHRDNMLYVANPTASGLGNISETLYSLSPDPQVVVYVYTLTANSCTNVDTVKLTLNPTPKLSNPHVLHEVCDSTLFSFAPTSLTAGTTFDWNRDYVSGINNIAATGTGNPMEYLKNNTYINVPVVYIYTLTANGCSNAESIDVMVHPTPKLSSVLTHTVCSSAPFTYTPTSYTPSTTFAWSRPAVTGITPATASAIGNIWDVMTSASGSPINVVYVFTLTANGCSHTQNINVTVNPAPVVPGIITHSPDNVCGYTMFQNFGVATPPPAGMHYSWNASNAIVYAVSPNTQYVLVNFNIPGVDALIYFHVENGTTGCGADASFPVHVGSGGSAPIDIAYFEGQLICKSTSVDSYQWGYDDDQLDSTVIAGAINQHYTIPYLESGRHYWCMTRKGDCSQKSYYNTPTAAVEDVNAEADIKVYPNPTNDYINVAINTQLSGNIEVSVINLMGQKLDMVTTMDRQARINVGMLPSGCYVVECVKDGIRIASSRFIKN